MGKKKRKLRKAMHKRELDDAPALVVCVGKKCCSRDESREVLDAARAEATALASPVRVIPIDCLHVCKDGPIAATYPHIKFKKHVSTERATKLVDKLDARRRGP